MTKEEHAELAAGMRVLAEALDDPGGSEAIEWSYVKEIIAKLIKLFGPVLLPIIVSWLSPSPGGKSE